MVATSFTSAYHIRASSFLDSFLFVLYNQAMSIFERFKGKEKQISDNNGEEWAEVAALANERQKSDEQIKKERFERKVISAVYSGDLTVLEQDDSPINKGPMEATIVEKAVSGEIDIEGRGRDVLGNLPTAVAKDGAETVYRRLGQDLHQKSVVAYMSGLDWAKRTEAGVDEINKVANEYPTIMDFNEGAQKFLDVIEKGNGEEKRKEYERDVYSVGVKIYGNEQAAAFSIIEELEDRADKEKIRRDQREALWGVYDKK